MPRNKLLRFVYKKICSMKTFVITSLAGLIVPLDNNSLKIQRPIMNKVYLYFL